MKWEITYYSEKVQQDVLSFPAGIQARYIHLTSIMRAHGPDIGEPHTKALGQGLFELRMKAKEGIGRAFYCTYRAERNKIMILNVFVKKTQKTPKNEIEKARKRKKEITGK